MNSKSQTVLVSLLCAGFASSCFGQDQPAQPSVQVVQTPPAAPDPKIIEDGGLSIQLNYWLTRAQPVLRGGGASTVVSTEANLDYPGKSKSTPWAEISIPTGHGNTVRLSYFRTQGRGDSTSPGDLTLFSSTAFSTGDYLSAAYTLQNAKISWDYLSYTFEHSKHFPNLRFKTLYEIQYTTIYSSIDAPLRAISTDSSGNAISNTATGTKYFFYPTFGGEFEEAVGKHFRWEAKASGFGFPHHSALWDAEATAVWRVGSFDVMAGEKGFHFKTSPKADEYLRATLDGAYVGVRYYWRREQ